MLEPHVPEELTSYIVEAYVALRAQSGQDAKNGDQVSHVGVRVVLVLVSSFYLSCPPIRSRGRFPPPPPPPGVNLKPIIPPPVRFEDGLVVVGLAVVAWECKTSV